MEWIKIIAPLIGVALGWGLSERAKIWADKRKDTRKLRRLLFYVLELRFHFKKELDAQKQIEKYIDSLKTKLKTEFGEEMELDPAQLKPFIEQVLENHFGQSNEIDFLEDNIDSVIVDLSEVFPVFAYELSGQYRIKERLQKVDTYLSDMDEHLKQMPFDFKGWLKPKLTTELLTDIDSNLRKIADKVGSSISKEVEEKIKLMDISDDTSLDNFMTEYVNKIKQELK